VGRWTSRDDGQLKLDAARSFFEAVRFFDDFHRAARPMTAEMKPWYLLFTLLSRDATSLE
jgi:hypothetical protein